MDAVVGNVFVNVYKSTSFSSQLNLLANNLFKVFLLGYPLFVITDTANYNSWRENHSLCIQFRFSTCAPNETADDMTRP